MAMQPSIVKVRYGREYLSRAYVYVVHTEIYNNERLYFQNCSDFVAADALRSNVRFKSLDETGVIGIVCRHEYPVMLLSMQHGERQAIGYTIVCVCVCVYVCGCMGGCVCLLYIIIILEYHTLFTCWKNCMRNIRNILQLMYSMMLAVYLRNI